MAGWSGVGDIEEARSARAVNFHSRCLLRNRSPRLEVHGALGGEHPGTVARVHHGAVVRRGQGFELAADPQRIYVPR